MCHRFAPLTLEEVEEALASRELTGRARIARHAHAPTTADDAFPGSVAPVIVPAEDGRLKAALMTWGFWGRRPAREAAAQQGRKGPADADPSSGSGKLVFNTRLETAVEQLRSGRGLWADAIAGGRCLVPARAFYENGAATPPNAQDACGQTGLYRFTLVGTTAFLMAGICQNGRFSLVTTAPNAQVGAVHNRMPLVLGQGESTRWLQGDPQSLADRGHIDLAAERVPKTGRGQAAHAPSRNPCR